MAINYHDGIPKSCGYKKQIRVKEQSLKVIFSFLGKLLSIDSKIGYRIFKYKCQKIIQKSGMKNHLPFATHVPIYASCARVYALIFMKFFWVALFSLMCLDFKLYRNPSVAEIFAKYYTHLFNPFKCIWHIFTNMKLRNHPRWIITEELWNFF